MSQVEERYNQALDAMSPAQRLQRTAALYTSMQRMLEHQVRKEFPGLSQRELKWHVAQRMYLSDAATQRLLQQYRDRRTYNRCG